jgi:hypothetical protein
MKKRVGPRKGDEMRRDYDFASMKSGIRGTHYQEYRKRTKVVLLKPDVAEAFPTEDAVNEALRGILKHNPCSATDDRTLKPAAPRRTRRRS